LDSQALFAQGCNRRVPVWGVGFLCVSLFFKFQPPLSRVYVALATVTAMIGLYTGRRFFNSYLRRESIAGKLRQRILVVGWTAYAQRLTEIIGNDPCHPLRDGVLCADS
jgi:hypothetical protein